MTTTTLRRATGDNRWRTADQHLLNMPRAARDDHADERELAARAVHRIAGDHATELLDILGLLPAADETINRTEKECTGCKTVKARSEFYKRPTARDGLQSQCKACEGIRRKKNRKPKPTKVDPEPDVDDRTITCQSCGKTAEHEAHGWCHACFLRWDRAGRPDTGPPPVRCAVLRAKYWQLTRGDGHTLKNAAELMKISTRTAERYEAHFKTHGTPMNEQEAA